MLPRSPAAKAEAQWPPRSPREVLLSTPGGRARLRRLEAARTSPSPSPSRLRTVRPDPAAVDEADADEDEDEETLQLQLQEIQAKLRLKKLQAAKAQKPASSAATSATRQRPLSPPRRTVEVPASPVRRTAAQLAAETVITAATQKSPKRVLLGIDKGLRGQDVSLKRPPAFRRGLTTSASVSSSLSLGGEADAAAAPRPMTFNERLAAARNQEATRQDKMERIHKLRASAFSVGKEEMDRYKTQAVDIPTEADRPHQYSRDDILGAALGRRPAAAAASASEGGALLRRSNTAPGIRGTQHGRADGCAASSQEDRLTAGPPASSEKAAEDAAADSAGSFEPYSGYHLSRRVLPHAVLARSVAGKTSYSIQDLLRDVKAPNFELPDVETDVVVFGIVASKSQPRAHKVISSSATDEDGGLEHKSKQQQRDKDRGKYMVLTLVDLTYQIDLFLFKSGFDRFWKLSTGTVVGILNPGVMPPPPGRQDTGRWALVINSDADTILEIGTARDLGYCKSVKRDGQLCSDWVNAKRTEFCAFHTNEGLRKMRATRNEVNGAAGFGTSDRGGGGGRGRGGGGWGSRGGGTGTVGYDFHAQSRYYVTGQGGASSSALIDHDEMAGYADQVERKEGLKRRLAARERESDIARKLGQLGSGAGRDYMQLAAARRKEEAEAAAAVENEKKKKGKGAATTTTAAASFSSVSTASSSAVSVSTATPASSASFTSTSTFADQAAASRASLLASLASTGRGRGRAAGAAAPEIHLGGPPVKRKRPASSVLSTSTATSTATTTTTSAAGAGDSGGSGGFGWGSNLRAKLGRMKDGERLQTAQTSIEAGFRRQEAAAATASTAAPAPARPGEHSPVRKKTRFLLGGKGIREAGRESLGAPAVDQPASDDEDELVII